MKWYYHIISYNFDNIKYSKSEKVFLKMNHTELWIKPNYISDFDENIFFK